MMDVAGEMYAQAYRIRRAEEEIARLYPTDKIRSPVHLSIGQEGVAVAICAHLRPDDVVFSSYRSHAAYLAKGGDLRAMMAELFGKGTGCAKGKAGSMHLVDSAANVLGTSAVVGTGIGNATGYAYAHQYRQLPGIVVCFFGDGASEEGIFYESMNFAALKQLPILFVCENNFYAIHTHQSKRQARCDIAGRAAAIGVPSEMVGNNVMTLHEVAGATIERIRAGDGPRLLECQCYRYKEHVGPGEDFHLGYRTEDDAEIWRKDDPVRQLATLVDTDLRQRLEAVVEEELAAAIDFAESSPWPPADELLRDVYKTREG